MNRKELGKLGEKIAEKYLSKKGYKILDRNFSKRFASSPLKGEIDLIAKKDSMISFVEVKTLRASCPELAEGFSPEQKVNLTKRKTIAKIAQIWLQDHNISLDTNWGIDVVAITVSPNGAKVRHFRNIRLG